MAIALTAVVNKKNYKSWTITCLDADTSSTVAHGFVTAAGVGFAPDLVSIQSAIANGGGSSTVCAVWGVTVDATNLYLVKQNSVGSGGTAPGTTVVAKLVAWKPHSVAS
jgi:hypothetical protein